jgi:hypothetical protein
VKSYRLLGAAVAALALLSVGPLAEAQTAGTVKLTPSVTTCSVKCTPTLTWSTTPAAASCSATWTSSKAASGSQALSEITKTTKYDITCVWPGVVQSVTVAWEAPTQNTDLTPLTDLAGYKVLFGTTTGALTQSAAINNAAATSASIAVPSAGQWYFAVRAVNSKGTESDNSSLVTATSTSSTPAASSSVSINVDTAPKPPTNVTATVALASLNVPLDSLDGFKRSPVFTITNSGPGVLAGFVKVGTPITAKILVYKQQDWCTFIEKHPRTGTPNVAWYGDPRPIDSVIAPCA